MQAFDRGDAGARPALAALKDELKAYARSLGVVRLGVTGAEPFESLRTILRQRQRTGLMSPFEEADIDLRCEPQRVLPGARALISIAVSYHVRSPFPAPPPQTARTAYRRRGLRRHRRKPPLRPPWRGWISRHAWGRDYHRTVRDKLDAIAAWLTERYPGSSSRPFVDTGPLVDRAVAERAGVGWIGRNCSLIVPGAGSWVVLGTLVTTVPLPPDPPAAPPGSECGDCDLCLRACPTGALFESHRLNPHRCLSYITQMRGAIPPEFREALGSRIYGCDTCQAVCPKNRDLPELGDPGFVPAAGWEVAPELLELLRLGKKAFRMRYGDKAAGWRGKTTLQRNAVIALGNTRHPGALPQLAKLLYDDVRPVIRGAAAWAIGRIGGDEAVRLLRQALEREQDAEVVAEIRRGLDLAQGVAAEQEEAMPPATTAAPS
ncbi:MAG TPA: tRNA epoxyqueuosine(34) reductase QueG [Bacillota bacterium]